MARIQREVAVVTGIGLRTGFGGREATWEAVCAGRSIANDSVREGCGLGRESGYVSASDSELDPLLQYALVAAAEAWIDAGLGTERVADAGAIDPFTLGCVIGTSKPALRAFADGFIRPIAQPDRVSELVLPDGRSAVASRSRPPSARLQSDVRVQTAASQLSRPSGADVVGIPQWWPSAPATAVAQRFDCRAAALAPVAACGTGLVALCQGADLIESGQCERVLAGSTDASAVASVEASYRRLGVLAKPEGDGIARCRPYDRQRSGFVIGEGAAVLVLESEREARRRGARIYARWLGHALAADGTHLMRLDPDHISLEWLLREVLRRAETEPERLDYVNLHGTGTHENDRAESAVLRRVWGSRARRVPLSSCKGALGHLLGAAGSVETAITALAVSRGVIPPTAQLETADPECDLDYTPGTARVQPVRQALKLSIGFGGHLAAAVLGQA